MREREIIASLDKKDAVADKRKEEKNAKDLFWAGEDNIKRDNDRGRHKDV